MIKLLAFVGGGFALMILLAALFQDRMVFFPDADIAGTPERLGLDFEDVRLTASDGVRLHGWLVPRAGDELSPVVVFFHGNAGNISHRLEMFEIVHNLGLSCLMIDYRGYGRSQGKPSEKGLYRDAEAAWNWLVRHKEVPPGRIICWGRSLGGPVAARLARDKQPGAAIIESSFTSLPELGQTIYPFLPVRLIARLHFPTKRFLEQLSCPVLVVHSPEDEVVPFSFGRELFESAPEPKRFLRISGGHNNGFAVSGQVYQQGILDFLGQFEMVRRNDRTEPKAMENKDGST
jgi:hypothetical protein